MSKDDSGRPQPPSDLPEKMSNRTFDAVVFDGTQTDSDMERAEGPDSAAEARKESSLNLGHKVESPTPSGKAKRPLTSEQEHSNSNTDKIPKQNVSEAGKESGHGQGNERAPSAGQTESGTSPPDTIQTPTPARNNSGTGPRTDEQLERKAQTRREAEKSNPKVAPPDFSGPPSDYPFQMRTSYTPTPKTPEGEAKQRRAKEEEEARTEEERSNAQPGVQPPSSDSEDRYDYAGPPEGYPINMSGGYTPTDPAEWGRWAVADTRWLEWGRERHNQAFFESQRLPGSEPEQWRYYRGEEKWKDEDPGNEYLSRQAKEKETFFSYEDRDIWQKKSRAYQNMLNKQAKAIKAENAARIKVKQEKTAQRSGQSGAEAQRNDKSQEELQSSSRKDKMDEKRGSSGCWPQSTSLFNPIYLLGATFYVIAHSFFTSFGTLILLVIYIVGLRLLGEVLLSSGTSASASNRDVSQVNTSFWTTWGTHLTKTYNIQPAGVFCLLNLWSFLCIPLVTFLMSTAITRADRPSKMDGKEWWRSPFTSTGSLIKSTLVGIVLVLTMDANLYGPMTFFDGATLRTYCHVVLFLIQLVFNIELFRQALCLAYMAINLDTQPDDSLPDLAFDTSTLGTISKSLTPEIAFCMFNAVLVLTIITSTASWSALLHPRSPSSTTTSKSETPSKPKKPWRKSTLLTFQLICAVILSTFFISINMFFSTVISEAQSRVSLSTFVLANVLFGICLPGMGWVLTVFAIVSQRVWRKTCGGGGLSGR